ncbi:MAG: MgtC/SapB family protein [Vicinamibacteria bacterium]
MELFRAIFGDLRQVIPSPLVEFVIILVSVLCGAIVGAERERAEKPAGLRTLTLICLGSTIFTVMSIDPAFGAVDPTRVAAQIVTGVGFLGAGAILRERGSISGLTTAASIWVISAVGMVVGVGYALSGLVLAALIYSMLTFWHRVEDRYLGTCDLEDLRMVYATGHGKNRARLQCIFDSYSMPLQVVNEKPLSDGRSEMILRYCRAHKTHRAFQGDLAGFDWVESLEQPSRS